MNRILHRVAALILLLIILLLGYNLCQAVVPYPLTEETTSEVQTVNQQIMEVSEQLQIYEQQNVNFLNSIKTGANKMTNKEIISGLENQEQQNINYMQRIRKELSKIKFEKDESIVKDKVFWLVASICILFVLYYIIGLALRHR